LNDIDDIWTQSEEHNLRLAEIVVIRQFILVGFIQIKAS